MSTIFRNAALALDPVLNHEPHDQNKNGGLKIKEIANFCRFAEKIHFPENGELYFKVALQSKDIFRHVGVVYNSNSYELC